MFINWNCCTDNKLDVNKYNSFELDGCINQDGCVVRVESIEQAHLYTLFGHLKTGGTEDLHDFEISKNRDIIQEQIKEIRNVCAITAKKYSLELYDYTVNLEPA